MRDGIYNFSHPPIRNDLTSYYGKSALERNRMANRESKREKSHGATDMLPTLGSFKVVQGRSRDKVLRLEKLDW